MTNFGPNFGSKHSQYWIIVRSDATLTLSFELDADGDEEMKSEAAA
jgi:hypothetical protein